MRLPFIQFLPAVLLLAAFGWWLGVTANDVWSDRLYAEAHNVPTSQLICDNGLHIPSQLQLPGPTPMNSDWVSRGIDEGYLPATAQPVTCWSADGQGHELAVFSVAEALGDVSGRLERRWGQSAIAQTELEPVPGRRQKGKDLRV
jgi:hypothetical protein